MICSARMSGNSLCLSAHYRIGQVKNPVKHPHSMSKMLAIIRLPLARASVRIDIRQTVEADYW